MRDAILTVSGDLIAEPGGPPVMIQARPDGMVTVRERPLADPADPIPPERLPADAPGLQPLALDRLRPALGRDQLPGSRRVGPAAPVAVHDQRRVPRRTGRPLRPEGRTVRWTPTARPKSPWTGHSGSPWLAPPTRSEIATCRELLHRQTQRGLSAGYDPPRGQAPGTRPALPDALNTSEFLFAE